MKNLYKLFGIIALAVIIGSSLASCGDAGDSGGTVTNEKAVYTSVDDEGNKYELTITPQSDKAAYEPKTGDTYTLTIYYKDGTTKTSVGTVTHEVKNGSSVTATLSVSDISYTVTLLTVTDDVRVFTEIKGTIPITDGNDDDPPTIEIELTLTPQVENENKAVIGVILNKTALALDVGGSETLVATVLPSNAANKAVTWSSSSPAIATVSSSGLITAMAAGSATITVTTEEGDKAAICNVTVKEVVIGDIAVTGVTLNKMSTSLLINGTETLTATVLPSNATNKAVTWSSSNNAVATVSANGVVNAVSAGSATITVKTEDGGFTATCAVSVTSGSTNVPVTGVTLNKITTGLLIGGTETLYESVLPSNATNKAVTWNSSNTSIVTVTNGLITGIAAGTANITVTTADGNKTANCGILVSASAVLPTGVRLNKTILELGVGDTETLTATVLPTNATDQNVTWEITNPPDRIVATVSDSGVVRAVSVGDSQIFAITSNGIKTPCAVKVRDVPVTGITLNKTTLALKVGESETLIATVLPANATNKAVEWRSNNEAVAKVSSNGAVTAESSGNATITVETVDGKKTAICAVTVTSSYVPVTGVTLNKNTLNLYVGESETLTATVLPPEATNKAVTWSSSNYDVATVSTNGLVTAVSSGTATITVTTVDGNKAATCAVTVTPTTVSVERVFISKATLALGVGGTETLSVNIEPTNATNKSVSWSSNVPSVATVSSQGLVNAISAGNAIITVTTVDGNKTATCAITVTASSGGDLIFTSIAAFKTWLDSQPDNTTASAYAVKLNVNDLKGIDTVLKGAPNKYVKLDLSGSTITSIGYSAFYGCSSLASVTIPNSVTIIDGFAFHQCTSLASVTFAEPSKVTSIGNEAFDSCTSLTSITIPNSVTSIGYAAFTGCINLTSITIPNVVTSIESITFFGCTSLASVTFAEPSKVTSIGVMAFWGCTSLISVIIPNSVTSIEMGAFGSCTNLASVTFSATSKVTNIGNAAFQLCTSLTSITIPDSVTSIEGYAFNICTSLVSVIFQGTIPSSGFEASNTFNGDLRDKFYETDAVNGTPGTYNTTAPVSISSVWTKQ